MTKHLDLVAEDSAASQDPHWTKPHPPSRPPPRVSSLIRTLPLDWELIPTPSEGSFQLAGHSEDPVPLRGTNNP
jgi:hypothetical protein